MEIKNYINEVWKPVIGYYGLYEVSNYGRVRSVDNIIIRKNGIKMTKKSKILKPCVSNVGYYMVGLTKNNKSKTVTVHRLVAEAFIPNPLNLPCVDHINTIRTDNRVENLRWVSYSTNNLNPITHDRMKASRKDTSGANNPFYGKKHTIETIKKLSTPIVQYTLDGAFVREWLGSQEAARELGYNQAHISDCCLGKRKKHKGFIWKYKRDVV